MVKVEPHGWAFVSEDRLVHSGPLHLVRVIFHSNSNGDQAVAYDGLSNTGRQVFQLFGDTDYTEGYELGVELTTGLYVTLSGSCNLTVVFDPLGDE